MQIEVAAGEDDADAFAFGADAAVEDGSGGDGAGRLDNDLHALPQEKHGGHDFVFGDGGDVVDVLAEDAEGQRNESGAEAVGHGVSLRDRLDFS